MQITDTLLMIRPSTFCFNPETAATNFFQTEIDIAKEKIQVKALNEFEKAIDTLLVHHINVLVFDDTPEPPKPDAVFPNNWISTNAEGIISIFPMQAKTRRLERRKDIIETLSEKFLVTEVQDWSVYEKQEQFLEGTGSMVIDHQHRVIYACHSPRTDSYLLEKFASAHGYRAITFSAHDLSGGAIYHTNVMMCIGDGFAVLCSKAITDYNERVAVAQLLETTGHENIYISPEQMRSFAGNMLHVKNKMGDKFILLSKMAYDSLESLQIQKLEKYGQLLIFDVPTIEQVEGGSIRCMAAEIFLQKKEADK